jgi:hypothetical protein
MAYLLDANAFIQAKNLYYGLDFCPAFWDWLVTNTAAGLVRSIEKVGDEIAAISDELSVWAAAQGAVKNALKAANYVPANPDVKEPIFGTYSFVVIGPSADFEYAGLRREKANT